jgi:hypothetical protein
MFSAELFLIEILRTYHYQKCFNNFWAPVCEFILIFFKTEKMHNVIHKNAPCRTMQCPIENGHKNKTMIYNTLHKENSG